MAMLDAEESGDIVPPMRGCDERLCRTWGCGLPFFLGSGEMHYPSERNEILHLHTHNDTVQGIVRMLRLARAPRGWFGDAIAAKKLLIPPNTAHEHKALELLQCHPAAAAGGAREALVPLIA
jgi:hypothetical protein